MEKTISLGKQNIYSHIIPGICFFVAGVFGIFSAFFTSGELLAVQAVKIIIWIINVAALIYYFRSRREASDEMYKSNEQKAAESTFSVSITFIMSVTILIMIFSAVYTFSATDDNEIYITITLKNILTLLLGILDSAIGFGLAVFGICLRKFEEE